MNTDGLVRTLPSRVVYQYPSLPLQTPHEGGYESILVVAPALKLSDVINWRSKVVGAVSKRTMWTVLDAVPPGVCLIHTGAGFVVAKVVASLCVSSCSMEIRTTSMCVCVCVCV